MILHVEFQTEPKASIPFRMADYRLRVYRRFPQKQMRQVVVYLQPSGSELVRQTAFVLENTRHEFQVLRLWEQPIEPFLQAPGLLPFAVLSGTSNPAQALQQVAQQIEAIADVRVQSNVTASAAILAGLILDKEQIQRLLQRDLMRESVIYQDIETQARAAERREVAVKLLQEGVELEVIQRVTGMAIDELQHLQAEESGQREE